MRTKSPAGLAILSISLIAPAVLAKPIINWNLDDIINDIKNGLDAIANIGLGNLADPIQKEAKQLLAGVFPGSPGKPFSAALLPDILYAAEFASASYCDGTHIVGTETQCKETFCPTVTKNTVFTEANFANRGTSDTTGIVARDVTTKTIAVAFRGSQSIRNWFTNAKILLIPVPTWCTGCAVHSGFLGAFKEEATIVINTVTRLKKENPDYKIVVTGHSLGGALATLGAAELRKRGFKVSLFTYGAPRVGNEAFAKFLSASGDNFRVTHLNDPVPRLPPLTVGFRHFEPEYHIFQNDHPIAPTDIKVYSGTVNFEGNTGFGGLVNFNSSAHRLYFLPFSFSGCDDATREGIEFKR